MIKMDYWRKRKREQGIVRHPERTAVLSRRFDI
jgi:hypothetical protein